MAIKVLIINDQTDQQESYGDLVSKGFAVRTIHNKNEHIDAIRTMDPNVVIIDSQKPPPKNKQLVPSIRAISDAPILVISVIDKPGIVEKFLDQGADDYLLKPVSKNLLVARIKALARRSFRNVNEKSSKTDIKTSPIFR